MRRAIGLILAGLGAFLLVLAVMLRAYLPGQLIKFPINEYLKTQLIGHDVSYFSPAKVKPMTGATMLVTSTVKSVKGQGNSSTAVWDTFTYLYDETNHLQYNYSLRRAAFDRRTAENVSCCGANIGGNTSIRQSGLVGFLWPFGLQKRTYLAFDTTLNRAEPAHYAGTTSIDGITVYKMVEKVTRAQAGTQSIPANLVGLPGNAMMKLPEYLTATNTFFVDPVTGAQLNQIENQHLELDGANGQGHLLLLNASLTFTPQSLTKVVNIDKKALNEVALVTFIGPLAALVLGLAGLIGGILLARPRRDDQPHYEDSSSEPALDPAR